MSSITEQGKKNQEFLESYESLHEEPNPLEGIEEGTELQQALRAVHQSNKQLERAFDHLRDKLDSGTHRVQMALYRAQTPVRFARDNPIVLAPIAFVGGLFLGRLVGKSVST